MLKIFIISLHIWKCCWISVRTEIEFVGSDIFALKFGLHFLKTEDRDRNFQLDRMTTPAYGTQAQRSFCRVLHGWNVFFFSSAWRVFFPLRRRVEKSPARRHVEAEPYKRTTTWYFNFFRKRATTWSFAQNRQGLCSAAATCVRMPSSFVSSPFVAVHASARVSVSVARTRLLNRTIAG